MALKNYTTSITIEKTINEIESRLAKFGATHIFKVYDSGIPKGLAFTLKVQGSSIPFKLPMKEDKILLVLKKNKLSSRHTNLAQARRTGWRIIKDWIDSQLALIEIELAKPEEVFLPYVYDQKQDKTFFEKVEDGGFQNLLSDH